ncbi:MAG: type II toxin-antitoxin system HigB family toxin [Spirochaetia bacterium]|jgi:mRNA interferase HigB|nr:type II toxin-antitoxin system HigB family toxin [Spirochaetia bacterium]
MRVIAKRTLIEQYKVFPDCQEALKRWYKLMSKNNYNNLTELRRVFPPADPVDDLTVFNISGNKYRLIVKIIYRLQRVYIGNFLTHAEYNKNKWKE